MRRDDAVADARVCRITRRDAASEDVPARARRAVARIAPASTTSSASPRPTATPRRARIRSRRRPTTSNEIELTVERLDGRRGLVVPARRRRRRRRARGARPDRRVVRVGRRHAGAARRRRLGRRAAHGDAAARARDRPSAISCGSWCRCARPTTSTTPTSCPGPRPRSCTRRGAVGLAAPRRAGSCTTTSRRCCCPTPPPTCAARPRFTNAAPADLRRRRRECRSTGSASSASARPADARAGLSVTARP